MENVTEAAPLRVEAVGPVRVVWLNRPDKLNAVNAAMHTALTTVWRELAADPEARAIVVIGAGEAFTAGGDLQMLEEMHRDPAFRRHSLQEARTILREMCDCPLPVVAAVRGPAVGFGCSLALSADVLVMSSDAVLSDPHVALGVAPGDGGPVLLPLVTSLMASRWYLFTGDQIPADEAFRLGMATRVVPNEDLYDQALAMATRLAKLPPYAVQTAKRALNKHVEASLALVADFALEAEFTSFETEDAGQRIERMLERGRRAAAAADGHAR